MVIGASVLSSAGSGFERWETDSRECDEACEEWEVGYDHFEEWKVYIFSTYPGEDLLFVFLPVVCLSLCGLHFFS